MRRARLIGDAFVYAAEHDRTYTDGRLRDAYQAGDISLPPGWTSNGKVGTVPIPGFYIEATETFVEVEQLGISMGNNAWAMIALLALHRATGEAEYLTAALRIAQFVQDFKQETGTYRGFRGGLDQPASARRPGSSSPRALSTRSTGCRSAAAPSSPSPLVGCSTPASRAKARR